MIARALAGRPRLVVIDGLIDALPPVERGDVLQAIRSAVAPCTLVVTTNDDAVVALCERQLELNGLS